MLKRLMVFGGMLAVLLVAAAPAFAQQGPVTATGVLGEPYTEGQDPTVQYPFTDEATGEDYVLTSGFVDLQPYVGQRITIEAAPIGTAPGATQALNVTDVIESESGYEPAPLAAITGVIQRAENEEDLMAGVTHTVTEHSTGDVYILWSDAVDLTQYEGQSVSVYGVFQTQGNPLSSFEDPTDVLIAVTSVESLEPLPVEPPPDENLNVEITGVLQEKDLRPPHPTWSITEGLAGVEWTLVGGDVDLSQYVGQWVKVQGIFQTMGNPLPADPTVVPIYVTSLEVLDSSPATDDQYTNTPDETTVLPDTGGFSPAALVLVALLLLGGGGLLAYSFVRQR